MSDIQVEYRLSRFPDHDIMSVEAVAMDLLGDDVFDRMNGRVVTMENMLIEIEKGLEAGLYHLALGMTLCMPDICAALQSNNGETKKNKYVNWYDQYVGDQIRMSADDCYYFRCAFLHQGRTEHKDLQYRKIIFIEPSPTLTLHNNVLNDVLNIDIQIFCKVVIEAARNWYEEHKDTENYKRNAEYSIKRYPEGLAPYIVGVPVYG